MVCYGISGVVNLSSLVKKKTSFRKFRAGKAKKSDRKAYVILHVQSKQSNVLLVKTQGLNFAKAP